MTIKNLKSLALAAVCLTGTVGAFGQSAVDGAIGGTVEDATGAVVPNAKIIIHNNGTNAEQTVMSDGSGYFRVIHLQSGEYTVSVMATGFEGYKALMLASPSAR